MLKNRSWTEIELSCYPQRYSKTQGLCRLRWICLFHIVSGCISLCQKSILQIWILYSGLSSIWFLPCALATVVCLPNTRIAKGVEGYLADCKSREMLKKNTWSRVVIHNRKIFNKLPWKFVFVFKDSHVVLDERARWYHVFLERLKIRWLIVLFEGKIPRTVLLGLLWFRLECDLRKLKNIVY